jgi:hypothetical protein
MVDKDDDPVSGRSLESFREMLGAVWVASVDDRSLAEQVVEEITPRPPRLTCLVIVRYRRHGIRILGKRFPRREIMRYKGSSRGAAYVASCKVL